MLKSMLGDSRVVHVRVGFGHNRTTLVRANWTLESAHNTPQYTICNTFII